MSLTFIQIVNQVTAKLGQTDATSVALVKTFVQNRYRMIYDAFPWKDAEMTAAAATTAGVDSIALPTGMDRVIAIRSNGDTFLDPISNNLLLQTDPTIFERVGLPVAYREYTNSTSNVKAIALYPTPNTIVALFIVGKRTPPALSADGDTPILRNIDNVLISYAMGDMLERQRQYGKAEGKFTEASALLQAAKDLESGQANQVRRIKQLTVAGNSLAELTDAVCARTGQWGLDSSLLVREFLRRNYQAIYDACNWPEATVMARVNSDGSEIVLPFYFDRLISIRADVNLGQLSPVQPQLYFGIAPSIFEQTGSAIGFSYLTPVGVATLPPTREKLSFASSSASDKSSVFVMGELAGEEISETIALNGTTPVVTANEYDTPLTVAKNITVGNVLVTGNTSSASLVRILAGERERKHMRIWLQPTPPATVCLALGKRRIKPLVQDEDTPLLRDIEAALIAAASADMFLKIGDKDGAAAARSQADAALKTMVSLETEQGAFSACVVPEVDRYQPFDWSANNWLVAKI